MSGRRTLAGLAAAGLAAAVACNWPLGESANPGLTHFSVAGSLLDAGRLPEAQAEAEAAVTDLPSFAPAHSRLGDVLRTRGQPERALASYDRALALDAELAGAWAGRGIALDALGRDGGEDYRKALSLEPSQPDANNNLANRLLRQGNAREAIAMYERALAARPDDAGIASNLGTAHLQIGDTARALPLFDRALTRDPKLAGARINRAATLAALGRTDEARADLEALLAQEPPQSPYAQAARSALDQLAGR